MRVTILGATGYLGSALAENLAIKGHEVHAWGHKRTVRDVNWCGVLASISYGDVGSNEVVERIIGQSPDAIIYTVSLDHNQSEASLNNAFQANVLPVARLLERISAELPECRFLYFSTAQIYGVSTGTISEDTPPHPVNNYGLTHLLAEQIVRKFVEIDDMRAWCLRISNGYGAPRLPDTNCSWLVVNDLCRMALEDSEIRLQSDGSPQRDFIHLRDIGRAVDILLDTRSGPESCCCNVGGGATYSIRELADHVAQVLEARTGQRIPIFLPRDIPAPSLESGEIADRFQYDISSVRDLGYAPEVSLDMGIGEVLDWMQNRSVRK